MSNDDRLSQQSLKTDTRAVSVAVDYIIGFGILLILSATFSTAIISITDSHGERTVEQELTRLSNNVAYTLEQTDVLLNYSEDTLPSGSSYSPNATLYGDLPQTIAGQSYSITIRSNGEIIAISDGIEITTNATVSHDIQPATLNGDSYLITYDRDTGALIIHE